MKYAQVPDDFKYSTSVAEATIDIRMAFIRKVYAILWVTFVIVWPGKVWM